MLLFPPADPTMTMSGVQINSQFPLILIPPKYRLNAPLPYPKEMPRREDKQVIWVASQNLGCALDEAITHIVADMLAHGIWITAFQDAKRPPTDGFPIPHGFTLFITKGQSPVGFVISSEINPDDLRFHQHDEAGRVASLHMTRHRITFITAYAPVEGRNPATTNAPGDENEDEHPFWSDLHTAVTDTRRVCGRIHVIGDFNAHITRRDLSHQGHDTIPAVPDVYPTTQWTVDDHAMLSEQTQGGPTHKWPSPHVHGLRCI